MARAWRGSVATVAIAVLAALGTAGCSEDKKDTEADGPASTTGSGDAIADAAPDCERAAVVECAPAETTIAALLPAEAERAQGTPIRVGLINTESGPATSMPELGLATAAGVRWVNEELGGVDGRPLELVACDTGFSPAGSQRCAQQMVQEDVVAVLGGFDIFGDGTEVLEQNGIPLVGGIPASFAWAQNPVSFQFSGGIWGALLGFADFAARRLEVGSVAIVYNEFGPITDAATRTESMLHDLGVDDVAMVPIPIVNADLLGAVSAANASEPDAIFFLVADTACIAVMQGADELGVRAAVFLTGACAAPKIIEAVGPAAVEGRYFNTEGAAGTPREQADFDLYAQVVERYEPTLDPQGAGIIAFKGLMNLYAQMRSVGADDITPAALIARFRAARDEPSFSGHPYTCDGRGLEGLPALCSPQQVIIRISDGAAAPVGDWIELGAVGEAGSASEEPE